jgi:serine protease Do
MNRKILIIIIIAAFIGGLFGSLVSSKPVEANLFKNFYDQYLEQLIQPKADQQPIINSQESTVKSRELYAPTVDYEQAVIKAVEQASPAVISIVISKNVPIIKQCLYNPFGDLPPEFQQFFGQGFSTPGGPASGWEFYQPCQKGTQLQEVGGGSGFIISSDGLIVTNKHVVFDEKAEYTVFTNDGKKYKAEILAKDSSKDLAIIKISAQNLPVLQLGDSDSIKLGQTAIAIGNALGEFRNTVSVGVISGLSRRVTASGGDTSETLEGLIQTDAAINAGNSGGPLLNLKGEVIGINVAMVSGAQNISFTIPINQVKKAIESVKTSGRIISPYLGVRYMMITADLAKGQKLATDNGALIQGDKNNPAVLPNSPAAKAGLKAGDIITEINGKKLVQDKPLGSMLQEYNVGDKIKLKILRNNKEIILEAILEERPKNL